MPVLARRAARGEEDFYQREHRKRSPESLQPHQPSTSETGLLDGLEPLRRGDTIYINEPHPSGGSVIASFPKDNPSDITYYLNDLLGTTLATVNGSTKQFAKLTAFGQPLKQAAATASPTDLIAGDLPANPVPETDSTLQTTP